MKKTTLKAIACLCFLLFSEIIFAQNEAPEKYTSNNKGKFFISWGGNRATYSKSDIRFKGEGYDFTIKDASAIDKPKGWHLDYINPTRVTIPQTNLKIGYFISNKYALSLGVDHMKYVMKRDRRKQLYGYVNLPEEDEASIYNQTFNGEGFIVSSDFLKFEHTNGLNYVYLNFSRYDDISSLFGINNTDVFQLNITEGVAAGILYPKTNTELFLKERYDEFHLAGYGVSLNAGLNLTFFKHYFIQLDLRGGFVDMPDIRTTSNSNESASQHFYYLQRVIAFGGKFRI